MKISGVTFQSAAIFGKLTMQTRRNSDGVPVLENAQYLIVEHLNRCKKQSLYSELNVQDFRYIIINLDGTVQYIPVRYNTRVTSYQATRIVCYK